jgi:hypothetical protein
MRSATTMRPASTVETAATLAMKAPATVATETPATVAPKAGAASHSAVIKATGRASAIYIAASTNGGAPGVSAAANKSSATIQSAIIEAPVVIPAPIKSAIVISSSIKPAPKSVEPRTGSDKDSVDEIIRPPESIRSARVRRVIVITVVADRRCAVSVTISATDSNSYRYLGV